MILQRQQEVLGEDFHNLIKSRLCGKNGPSDSLNLFKTRVSDELGATSQVNSTKPQSVENMLKSLQIQACNTNIIDASTNK